MANYATVVGEALLVPNQDDPDSVVAPFDIRGGAAGGPVIPISSQGLPMTGAMRAMFDVRIEVVDAIATVVSRYILPVDIQERLAGATDLDAVFSEWWALFTTNRSSTVGVGTLSTPVFGPISFPDGVSRDLWTILVEYIYIPGGDFPGPFDFTVFTDWLHSAVN